MHYYISMAEQCQEYVSALTHVSSALTVTAQAPHTDPEKLQPDYDAAPKSLQVDQYTEKFLSRIRSDSVYELRKLRHQYKPVSEFDGKLTLEELLGKRLQALLVPAAFPESATLAEDQDSEVEKRVKQLSSISQDNTSVVSPQEYMPLSVRLEIRGLVERQQVSGFLSSVQASDIDRTLQEGLERRRRRQLRRQAVRPFPGQVQNGRGRLLEEIHVRGDHQTLRDRANAVSLSENGQYRMPQRDQSSILRQLQESPALNSLQPAERDRVLTEVNHLVQQRLVTSALAGEFRGILELHIQNQIRNGVTVGHSLQRQNTHSVSTTRPFDPDEPSSASMSEMRQELRDVKSEILELKQLMRTSFDMQLEIQRAIRQEVAAALSSACIPLSTLSQPSIPSAIWGQTAEQSSVVVNYGHCLICSEASINCVIYRCGHMCVCMQCGLELKAQSLKCPICRAPITDIVRAYSSM